MIQHYNCHNRTTEIWSRPLVYALGVPQMAMTFTSVVFNSVVILVVACSKDLHKPICILFCNLAVSDFLTSSSGFWIATMFIMNPESTMVGTKDLLKAYTFYIISILATIYNLVAIGIERYLAVTESLWTRHRITRNQILGVVFVIWVFAFFLGFMPLMGWNCLEQENISALYGPLCIDYLLFIAIPHSAMALILPFFTYISIIGFLRKQNKSMGALGQHHTTYRLAEIQVVRTSVLIWVLTLLSYTPFFVGAVFDSATQRCLRDLFPGIYIFRNLTAMMITINSLGNPIIYTFNVKRLGHRIKPLRCPSNNRIEVQAIGKM
uniref:Lysophosphatidic acid receptor 1-like n=1 Tax=Pogona vitticeps TaxID=103695 RepID=A0A6J0T1H3_9SAUR